MDLPDASFQPAHGGEPPRVRLVARVDESTGFASDFLNQFNEAIMLLDCVAAGEPFAVDDLVTWKARTYAAHFGAGHLPDRFEIVRVYRLAPRESRRRLDELSRELSVVVTAGAAFLAACRRAGAAGSLAPMGRHLAADARRRLAALESLVRPGGTRPSHAEVSILFAHRAA